MAVWTERTAGRHGEVRVPGDRADGAAAAARLGDGVLLATLAAAGLMALVLGQTYGEPGLAAAVGGALFAAGLLVWWVARGTLACRLVLAVCAMSMVALQIQLGRGLVELHFGVFVLLALLLAYRDWRPIVAAAGVIAVHHLLFDACRPWASRCSAPRRPTCRGS